MCVPGGLRLIVKGPALRLKWLSLSCYRKQEQETNKLSICRRMICKEELEEVIYFLLFFIFYIFFLRKSFIWTSCVSSCRRRQTWILWPWAILLNLDEQWRNRRRSTRGCSLCWKLSFGYDINSAEIRCILCNDYWNVCRFVEPAEFYHPNVNIWSKAKPERERERQKHTWESLLLRKHQPPIPQ